MLIGRCNECGAYVMQMRMQDSVQEAGPAVAANQAAAGQSLTDADNIYATTLPHSFSWNHTRLPRLPCTSLYHNTIAGYRTIPHDTAR